MDRFLSVNELAKAEETTARAIRLYIDKGLLEPMRIGHILCFPEQARQSLKKILRAKRLGFSLEEIRAYQARPDTTAMVAALNRIELLISDAEIEASEIRHCLNQPLKRK